MARLPSWDKVEVRNDASRAFWLSLKIDVQARLWRHAHVHVGSLCRIFSRLTMARKTGGLVSREDWDNGE